MTGEYMNDSKRINFLGALKAFIILFVVFYHVLMAYIIYPIVPMFIHDRFIHSIQSYYSVGEKLFFLTLLLVINAPTMMSIMFFIAGYFALGPLIKKGPSQFLKDKSVRLGIPFVLGTAVLAPLAAFIAYLPRGTRINYFAYWFLRFFRPNEFSQYHFWFLGVLLLFFLVLSLIFLIVRDRISSIKTKPGKPSLLFFMVFIAITTGMYFVMNLFYPAEAFTQWYVLQFQTVIFLTYAAYFVFGIYAYTRNWFIDGYKPKIIPWTIAYAISICMYLFTILYMNTGSGRNTMIMKLVNDLCNNVSILSALFMLLAIFRKYLNGDAPVQQAICRSSYSTYLIHFLVVFVVIYVSRDIPLSLFPRFLMQLVIGVSLSWGIGYSLTRIPIVRRVL
jgi:glucans biosynthesis protein C